MENKEFAKELMDFINKRIIGSKNYYVDENSKLFENRIINSMKIIELIAFVEKKLKIKIHEDMITMENFESVLVITNKFTAYAKRKRSK